MRSLSEGLSGAAARSTPRDRSRAANKEDGAYVAAANENTATATAAKMMIGTSSISSDLDLNDPSNYKISDRLQHDPCSEQRMADGIVKQRADETGIPYFCSSKSLRNSVEAGSDNSSQMISTATVNACPALTARASVSIASGNMVSNFWKRRVLRQLT